MTKILNTTFDITTNWRIQSFNSDMRLYPYDICCVMLTYLIIVEKLYNMDLNGYVLCHSNTH